MPQNTTMQYSNDDLEALHNAARTRTVLTVIAAQTGVIEKPELTASQHPDDADSQATTRVHREGTTTSNIRAVTGLSNDEVNYELRKLKGTTTESITTQLIETRQQGTDDTGRQLPKLIVLTDAGEQAFDHGVVETESLATSPAPDWLPDASTDDQIEAVAERLDQHEVLLNELTHHIGFALFTELLSEDISAPQHGTPAGDRSDYPVLDRSTVAADPDAAQQFVAADAYSLLDALERLRTGQRAMKHALDDLDADPTDYIEQ
ncbi:hypothetical protein [Halorubrum halodurans]|nr:hypothetical protein [Halorubrum halodurans]